MIFATNPDRAKSLLLQFLIWAAPFATLFAHETPTNRSIFDELNFQEVVDVELAFDINSLTADRRNSEEVPALFSYVSAEGVEHRWNIKVSIRGKFRRIKCTEMPPLKLNFSKKELERSGLAKFDDMKLVTLCMEDGRMDKNYLLKEYLGYKLYNELTEASYRVQLLRIHYKDSVTGESRKQLGFVIEDTAELRARIGAEKCKEERIMESERFDLTHRRMAAVFQYMIGNADWGIHHSKNIKYMLRDGKVVIVPYDFDFSALVSAGYASFSNHYGQKSIKDRVYLGFETEQTELASTLTFYESKKESMLQLINDFKLLPASERREMRQYLLSFFDESQHINFVSEKLSFVEAD